MLTDPREIAIAARAQQKNIRDPKRSREHFRRIFSEFFRGVPFKGRVLLDLGPGRLPFPFARARPAMIRSLIMERSNSANTPII